MKGTQEVYGIIISHSPLSRSLDKLYDLGIQTVTWLYFNISSPNGSPDKKAPSCPRLSTSQEKPSTEAPTEPKKKLRGLLSGQEALSYSQNEIAFEENSFVL